MADRTDIAKAVAVTAEVLGTELSEAAAYVMVQDLACYPAGAVLDSLERCRRELTGRLTLPAIIQRIDDGHPGPEEAWSLCPRSEAETAVWTDQVCDAFGVARPLLDAGDKVGARMAFLERYRAAVQEARSARKPARWWVSPGQDREARERAILDAVERKRLEPDHALRLVGSGTDAGMRIHALSGGDQPKRLEAPKRELLSPTEAAEYREQLRALTRGIGRTVETGE